MARGLSDGLLRFCNGAWRDDDGDPVEIAEVIRCKDCKHWHRDTQYLATLLHTESAMNNQTGMRTISAPTEKGKTMAKYADITPFYEWLDWLEKESHSRCPEYNTMMFYEIRDKLDDLPELTRCMDCRYFDEPFSWCDKKWHSTEAKDFCFYGERKDIEK